MDKVQKSGAIGLAHGGQPWQDATLFDGVVLATGGVEFYKKALVSKDPAALGSDTMKKVFERMAQLKKYVDKDFSNRDWNLASAMVIEGKAGFQIMGDWAKGEFIAAGKAPNKDFLCAAAPGTENAFTFNVGWFIFFKLKDPAAQKAQSDLASALMSSGF